MTGRHRTKIEEWTRAHRLASTGIVVSVVAILVTVSGLKIWNSDSSTENTTINACTQYCGGQTFMNQPPAAAPVDQNAGCSDDRNDKSLRWGWGPPRNLLAVDQYSEFPSFNLDNLPDGIGDERGIYDGRELTPPPNIWRYEIPVERGKTYILRIYIHNSAYKDPAKDAKGTRVSVFLPTCTGRRIISNGFITSTNASPDKIWGGVGFVSDEPFNLAYVKGSALLCNNHYTCKPDGSGGSAISEDFLTNKGSLIGYDALDGTFRGGYQYDGYFLYEVRPQFYGDAPAAS